MHTLKIVGHEQMLLWWAYNAHCVFQHVHETELLGAHNGLSDIGILCRQQMYAFVNVFVIWITRIIKITWYHVWFLDLNDQHIKKTCIVQSYCCYFGYQNQNTYIIPRYFCYFSNYNQRTYIILSYFNYFCYFINLGHLLEITKVTKITWYYLCFLIWITKITKLTKSTEQPNLGDPTSISGFSGWPRDLNPTSL